ncbi:glutamate ABC transporter substrate-binding protein [Kitasatospora sp. NPDC096147]|uniref:glutamate ABC transporter substrate-binding protein n=1 Tax=Kitasatospora sp. NPDC096147 TaxID=3364093 RepID=UPI0037F137ED
MRTARTAVVGGVTAALAAAGLVAGLTVGLRPGPAEPVATAAEPAAAVALAAPAAPVTGDCAERTVAPSSALTGRKVQDIKARGTLVVGVDQNSFNWGYRNPQTGKIEGFDIDLARAVAKAVLGNPDSITYRTVTTPKRIEAIRTGQVDLIVRTMTINCERWNDISFSAPYFVNGQRLVVPRSDQSRTVAEALRGKRACAAQASSSDTELKKPEYGTSSVTLVENQLDCLVLMQLGKVDSALTDGSLAAAQVAQDPTARMVDENLGSTRMGIGMKHEDTDLQAVVNQVLQDYRASGEWQASYDRWLAKSMGASSAPYLP